jgi:type III secretion protein C
LIKNLDIPLKQVFIEMLVIETSLTNALTFGLEWGGNYKYRDKFSASMFNTNPNVTSPPDTFVKNLANIGPTGTKSATSPITPAPQSIPTGTGFDLGVIGEVIRHNGDTFLSLGSLLTALQQDQETSIVTTPKILTQDGRTSSIFVGQNIPFVGSFVSNTTNSTINTSNIEYRDIGMNLTITPVLGNSDIVTLDISLDRSSTVGAVTSQTLSVAAQTANGIITNKATMQTTVHIPDNNFLILSGMIENSNVKAKTGIPCLGGLPIIGAAFSTSGDTISNSNIVIFIRPRIINSFDDMQQLTARQEDYFRDQAATPFLERQYDESMELIKTVDDE